MRVFPPVRRPPTLLEQLLGHRRARTVRRRVGFLALGAGVTLLKPRPRVAWAPVAMTAAVALGMLVGFGLH